MTISPKPNSGIVALVDDIINTALELSASDIHLEPLKDKLRVRYRVDGILQEAPEIGRLLHPAIISRLKIMTELDIAENRLPQDGRAHLKFKDRDFDLRLSLVPTLFGEKAVIRILNRDQLHLSLEDLGMAAEDLKIYRNLISRPYGIILVTGPTGCGKTTTLYASISQLNFGQVNITTIEDPIEYHLPGINQIQVNPRIGLNFAKGLRHVLRQDPDIIMVEEIRDLETARIAIQAALTGHLVFSTLHTNDTASAIVRLQEMGIEPYLLSAALSGVLAQRLVRTFCQNCQGAGCHQCRGTGFKGRTGIFEILKVSEKIKSLIVKGSSASTISETAISLGMLTMKDNGLEKVKQGITKEEEVMRVVCLEE